MWKDDRTVRVPIGAMDFQALPPNQRARVSAFAETVTRNERTEWSDLEVLSGYTSDALYGALCSSSSLAEWDDVVAAFGASLDDTWATYAGRMSVREGAPASPGFFLAHKNEVARDISASVELRAAAIGERLFGRPCDLRGRVVEFYDLQVATGSLTTVGIAPIAAFAPFFLGGWKDAERQFAKKRSLMWTNVVLTRFDRIAGQFVQKHVLIDGQPAALLSADPSDRSRAVALWLSLHEMFHGSGPAPLFEEWTGKAQGSIGYACIEEARVDMSSFLAAPLAAASDIARLAQELILFERLFRSARVGMARLAAGEAPKVDDDHGLIWTAACDDAFETNGGEAINLDLDGVVNGVTKTLGSIYSAEDRAAASMDPPLVLRDSAEGLLAWRAEKLKDSWLRRRLNRESANAPLFLQLSSS